LKRRCWQAFGGLDHSPPPLRRMCLLRVRMVWQQASGWCAGWLELFYVTRPVCIRTDVEGRQFVFGGDMDVVPITDHRILGCMFFGNYRWAALCGRRRFGAARTSDVARGT
jgi:hypothetical protein